jgi:hypothetical protein
MPKKVSLIQVFLASPGDFSEERELAADVIGELNRTVCPSHGIHLDLVKWETHAVPGFGDHPQSVINDSIPVDYDIFVGVLYRRFGTPTLRAESGTQEEFDRAFARFQSDKSSVRLMLYFKTKEFTPTLDELDQYRKVLDFKRKVGETGGLYSEYKQANDFATYLRIHLAQVIPKMTSRGMLSISEGANVEDGSQCSTTKTVGAQLVESESDAGLVELAELAEQSLISANEVTERIGSLISDFGASLNAHTSAADHLNVSGSSNPAEAKRIINQAASTLDKFADDLERELTGFTTGFRTAFDAISRAVVLYTDMGQTGEEQRNLAAVALRANVVAINEAKVPIIEMSNSIRNLPRLTTALNRAKARVSVVMEKMIGTMDELAIVAAKIADSAAS